MPASSPARRLNQIATLLGIPDESLSSKYALIGPSGILTFQGKDADLTIDGQSQELDDRATVVLFGGFSGYAQDTGHYSFNGQAVKAWKDGQRINPTRWERIRIELQIFLLTVVAALAATIGGFLISVTRWLSQIE